MDGVQNTPEWKGGNQMKNGVVPRIALFLILSALFMGFPSCTPEDESPQDSSFPVAHNDGVAQMIAGVKQTEVEKHLKDLTGVSPIVVGGQSVTLATRNTTNTAATQNATQYVYEFMQTAGVDVQYEAWTDEVEGVSGRNVIGQITGTTRPDEIVLVTAHVDDMPEGALAPGADDNASGSVGVMMVAARLAAHQFERTVRFVTFTGEEYGPSGSQAYAKACAAREENILGVLNLDMIGWDANNDGIMFLQTRDAATSSAYTEDVDIANAFIAVITEYGISALKPQTEGNETLEADTQSFWDAGFPAILAIEDEKYESNPNLHETTDNLASLNLPYCTDFIKAAVGTAAHMALPMP
jgi:Zn-dependent M28 family amino/carboxypeptidase